MAYLLESSVKDRDNLDYEFEGGDPSLTIDGLKSRDGRALRGSGLTTCFMFSVPVPAELMAAVPTRIVVKPASDGFIPDFAMAAMFSSRLVSDRFVALVERLEPNVHQFLPIKECVDRKGRPLGRSFFLVNVLTQLDAIDIERSDVQWKTMRFADQTEMTTLVRKPLMNLKLVVRRDVIRGHHLWQGGTNGLLGAYFISNELHDLMKTAGLSALRLTKCEAL
jgi:Immunity protein family (Imm11)